MTSVLSSTCVLDLLLYHASLFKDLWESFSQNQTEYLLFIYSLYTLGYFLLRKEVIHPHVPVGIPCYDLTPVIDPAFDGLLTCALEIPASGITNSHGLTGGVYKARERIHRGMLIRDY